MTSVQQEVDRLRNAGVKIIIALGHAGFTVDKLVGKIPGVDIVVGGHTNTFLYTGRSHAAQQQQRFFAVQVRDVVWLVVPLLLCGCVTLGIKY